MDSNNDFRDQNHNMKNLNDNSNNGIFIGLKPYCSFISNISDSQIDKLKR